MNRQQKLEAVKEILMRYCEPKSELSGIMARDIAGKIVDALEPPLPSLCVDCSTSTAAFAVPAIHSFDAYGKPNGSKEGACGPCADRRGVPHASDCATWVTERCNCITAKDPDQIESDMERARR